MPPSVTHTMNHVFYISLLKTKWNPGKIRFGVIAQKKFFQRSYGFGGFTIHIYGGLVQVVRNANALFSFKKIKIEALQFLNKLGKT